MGYLQNAQVRSCKYTSGKLVRTREKLACRLPSAPKGRTESKEGNRPQRCVSFKIHKWDDVNIQARRRLAHLHRHQRSHCEPCNCLFPFDMFRVPIRHSHSTCAVAHCPIRNLTTVCLTQTRNVVMTHFRHHLRTSLRNKLRKAGIILTWSSLVRGQKTYLFGNAPLYCLALKRPLKGELNQKFETRPETK